MECGSVSSLKLCGGVIYLRGVWSVSSLKVNGMWDFIDHGSVCNEGVGLSV